ncbi:MAG: winged helix-turn-helix domain-containing protein [Eubacteriales bacterium]
MNKKILIIEDEIKIIEVVESYLVNSGFDVYTASNGKEGLSLFYKINPVLLILDLMLPDMSGEEICMVVRKISSVPIMMLTAKSNESDILNGLEIGADDYILKPFSPRQLVARVKTLLRRVGDEIVPLSNLFVFHVGDVFIDTVKHEVKKYENIVNLTPYEYKILLALVKYPHKVFTRNELIEILLGDDYEGFDRTIDSHVKNLRKKIEENPRNPEYIKTIHGIGYKLGGEF